MNLFNEKEAYQAPVTKVTTITGNHLCVGSPVSTGNIEDWQKGNEDWF